MHPAEQRACDDVLKHPVMQTPPPEPEVPPPPRVRKPRVFKFPPRFPLITEQFYSIWTNHLKELMLARAKVDAKPPLLFPELYLKPRRLDYFAKLIEENMKVNKDLLKRINVIQRVGGYVDCWNHTTSGKMNKLMCDQRQREIDEIQRKNIYIYKQLLLAKSEQPTTKELDEMWQSTKRKLILGASQPFILFKQGTLDQGIKDPAFEKPLNVTRPTVMLEVVVVGGCKIGKADVELFTDIAPETCEIFLKLIKGDFRGYAYTGTRIFRIVPGLYCCCGDVSKDCGYGTYIPEGKEEPPKPENFLLKHSVPGVLSMVVRDNEVTGQFNIIFKPLPQFDEQHVVFGRIRKGPAPFLMRISDMGFKLGTTADDVIIKSCGWYSTGKTHTYREGRPNTIEFPPRKKKTT